MNWYIGQDIVCINAKGAETIRTKEHSGLKEGQVYTIIGLRKGCCWVEVDVGIPSIASATSHVCTKCNSTTPLTAIWWFRENRFRPLDELVNIDELTEILNEPAFQ